MGIGTPSRLVKITGIWCCDLTLIANDTAFVDTGWSLIVMVSRKVIASHIGTTGKGGHDIW
ncbi:hypothetical protein QT341_11960 [Escherichia coli]|nr:hypothetical protein [Escherichia coli]